MKSKYHIAKIGPPFAKLRHKRTNCLCTNQYTFNLLEILCFRLELRWSFDVNREVTIFCAGVWSSIPETVQSVDGIINPMSLSVICPDCRSQPATRSKTEGGAQMIVLQCFTTTRVGRETYPCKSKSLTIRGLHSTSTIGKPA